VPVPTVSAVVGAHVTLSCTVQSDPHYILSWRWYHNSSLITHAASIDNVSGSLVLSSLTKEDAGLYTCVVGSDGGHDNSSGWIHIIGRSLRVCY